MITKINALKIGDFDAILGDFEKQKEKERKWGKRLGAPYTNENIRNQIGKKLTAAVKFKSSNERKQDLRADENLMRI